MSKSDVMEKEKEEIELKEPSMYKVIMHNDNFTPMQFVTTVLISIFEKSQSEAEKIMMSIHNSNGSVAGIYVYEIAETKVEQTEALSNKFGFPLKCTIEESE